MPNEIAINVKDISEDNFKNYRKSRESERMMSSFIHHVKMTLYLFNFATLKLIKYETK